MNSNTINNSDLEMWASDELVLLKQDYAHRVLRPQVNVGGILHDSGKVIVNLSSNDYLNLSKHRDVLSRASQTLENFGVGATSSRLVSGSIELHRQLEEELSSFKGYEAGLIYGAGYLANVGALSALVGRKDIVISDKLIHASLIDGISLSRAIHRRFRHNDIMHLRQILVQARTQQKVRQRIFIITESVFSMDGDLAPLAEIRKLALEFNACLVVDEAHALGVFGKFSEGCVSLDEINGVEIITGTLSKALGSYGGFVLSSARLKDFLVNRSRAFIYNTALAPSFVAAALESLSLIRTTPELGQRLQMLAQAFRRKLQSGGLNVPDGESHIVPLIIGDNERTLRLAERLRDIGILVVAIRPPTVTAGTSRLRLSISLAHTEQCLCHAADEIIKAAHKEGL